MEFPPRIQKYIIGKITDKINHIKLHLSQKKIVNHVLDNVSPIRIDEGAFHLKIREKMNMNLTGAHQNM